MMPGRIPSISRTEQLRDSRARSHGVPPCRVPDMQAPTSQGKHFNTRMCDEQRPTCQRCIKARRICIDTVTGKQASFSFHLENGYASGATKRPRGPRSSLTAPRLQFDLHAQALAYYLTFHAKTFTAAPNVYGCVSECLSEWRASGKASTEVDLAFSAIALNTFSRTQKYPPAAVEASSKYHSLLRIVQARVAQVGIQTWSESNIEACLFAVVLMGRYEASSHSPHSADSKVPIGAFNSWSHSDGAQAILKVWNDDPARDTPTYIIKHARRTLIKSSLLRHLPIRDWMLNGESFGEHDLELDFDRILVRAVNLHYVFTRLQHKNDRHIANAGKLDGEAQELDEALQDWAARLPNAQSYRRHLLTESGPWPKKRFYSSMIYSYPIPGYGALWSVYFAARMLINSLRLRILGRSQSDPMLEFSYERQRLRCSAQLKAMGDSLASTIPFCLERFTVHDSDSPPRQTSITLSTDEDIKPRLATLVVWPLTIAASLEGVDAQQKRWFRSELAHLGRTTGDGVLEYAETNQWIVL